MRTSFARYKSSGSVRLILMVYFLLALIAGVLLSSPYQWLLNKIPWIYVNLLLCMGFGGLLGGLAYGMLRQGHCRNQILGVLLAIPLGAVPILASHYWEYQDIVHKMNESLNELRAGAISEEVQAALDAQKATLPPAGLTGFAQNLSWYINLRKEMGFRVKNRSSAPDTWKGNFVFILWGIETAFALALVLYVSVQTTRKPYCEACKRWCDSSKSWLFPGLSLELIKPLVEKGDLGALRNLPTEGTNPTHGLRFTCTYCPTCLETSFLSIGEIYIKGTDKNGNLQTEQKDLVNHIVLSSHQREEWINKIERAQQGHLSAYLPQAT